MSNLQRVYYCPRKLVYYERDAAGEFTGRTFTTPLGYPSDGASGPAIDIYSMSWFAHDCAHGRGFWDNGEVMTVAETSVMLSWYLKSEGHKVRFSVWKWATAWFGPHRIGLGEKQAYPEYAGYIILVAGGRDSLPDKEDIMRCPYCDSKMARVQVDDGEGEDHTVYVCPHCGEEKATKSEGT